MRQFRQLLAVALVVVGVAVVAPRADAGPTTDPGTAASLGGGWLARQINAQGFIPASTGTGANVGATVDAALALAAANVGGAAFTRAVNYLHGQIEAYVKDSGAADLPGSLAKLILLAEAAGEDATEFGGTAAANDLVARLLATKRAAAPDAGLFGVQDPSYDGVFRQSLAILALRTIPAVPGDAVSWLSAQQCPNKGWQSHRADTAAPCRTATDPVSFLGPPDTNNTAIATQAFRAIFTTPAQGDPLDFLDTAQNADGGFGFLPGDLTDANSTGVVIQAIVAGAESPTAGRWVAASGNPLTALLSLQLGCEAAEADRGAFDFQAQSPLEPNLLATVQAVPGAAQKPFPLATAVPAAAEPAVQCGGTTTTTSSTTTTTGATTSTTAPATATAPVATPLAVQPRYTG